MSLDTLTPNLSPVEIETTVQISADLSDSQIVLMHHVADIFTQGARVGLADSIVRAEPTPLDETDLLTLARHLIREAPGQTFASRALLTTLVAKEIRKILTTGKAAGEYPGNTHPPIEWFPFAT